VDLVKRYVEYAGAFERVYQSDAWKELEPYFTENAVYEVAGPAPFGGRAEGRDAVLAHLRDSLNAFDRRFPRRAVQVLEGPALRQGGVQVHWRASYSGPGLPELILDGEESASFEGERICRLEDRFPPEMKWILELWLHNFGSRLAATAR
jgi:hypothetical protein